MSEASVFPLWLPELVVNPSLRRLMVDHSRESITDVCTDLAAIHDYVWRHLCRLAEDYEALVLVHNALEVLKGRSISTESCVDMGDIVPIEQACRDLLKLDDLVRVRLIEDNGEIEAEAGMIGFVFDRVRSLLEPIAARQG